MFLSVLGEASVTKRSGAGMEGRMLHRPPPLMRIFRPPSAVPSIRTTGRPDRRPNKPP